MKEFTKKYEKAFFEDVKGLNIEKAAIYPRATEHVKDMVNLIRVLLKNYMRNLLSRNGNLLNNFTSCFMKLDLC